MPTITPSNPKTALVDLELNAVALCGEGCNTRADILLKKSRKETTVMPKTFEELMKALDPESANLVNTHIAGITKEHETAINGLNEQIKTLQKAAPAKPDEDILKTAAPALQALFAKQQSQIDALVARDADAMATARFEKCKALPVEEAELKDVLKAASPAVVSILEKAAAAIEKNIETPAGVSTGEHLAAGANGAYGEIEKAAKKLQATDSGLSFEAAFTKACEQDPELYAKYREEVR